MPSSHEWSGSSLADPDEKLLQQAREAPEGDLRAFEMLVLRHQRRVVANCRYITRDANNAEDLAQEVLVKAFFGLRGFEGRSSFGSWLQRIKINHCLNYLKKQAGLSLVSRRETLKSSINFRCMPPRSSKHVRSATGSLSARSWIRCRTP
jgi:DNA-directed RNA polymerase specialized sigma24 family protein